LFATFGFAGFGLYFMKTYSAIGACSLCMVILAAWFFWPRGEKEHTPKFQLGTLSQDAFSNVLVFFDGEPFKDGNEILIRGDYKHRVSGSFQFSDSVEPPTRMRAAVVCRSLKGDQMLAKGSEVDLSSSKWFDVACEGRECTFDLILYRKGKKPPAPEYFKLWSQPVILIIEKNSQKVVKEIPAKFAGT
jgi:hypothetical protein